MEVGRVREVDRDKFKKNLRSLISGLERWVSKEETREIVESILEQIGPRYVPIHQVALLSRRELYVPGIGVIAFDTEEEARAVRDALRSALEEIWGDDDNYMDELLGAAAERGVGYPVVIDGEKWVEVKSLHELVTLAAEYGARTGDTLMLKEKDGSYLVRP